MNRERETVDKLVHIAVQFHTFFTEINPGTGASAIMINYRGFGAVKIDRHGKAKVLSPEEIQRLFTSGLTTVRDRTLGAVMLYTGCRVNEAVTLKIKDVYNSKGRIRAELIIRKGNSKGKLATRSIPILSELRNFLATYKPTNSRDGFLFPGRWGRGHLHSEYASLIFRQACERVDIEGASTHSCRRTALTFMSNAGIPLRVIQEISGHRSLEQLQNYLEVEPSQVRGAIAALSMLSPPSMSSSNQDMQNADNTRLSSE